MLKTDFLIMWCRCATSGHRKLCACRHKTHTDLRTTHPSTHKKRKKEKSWWRRSWCSGDLLVLYYHYNSSLFSNARPEAHSHTLATSHYICKLTQSSTSASFSIWTRKGSDSKLSGLYLFSSPVHSRLSSSHFPATSFRFATLSLSLWPWCNPLLLTRLKIPAD